MANKDGRFNLLNLRVGGACSISISYIRLKTHEQNNVCPTLGKTFNVNAQLVIDSRVLDEVVVVSDAVAPLELTVPKFLEVLQMHMSLPIRMKEEYGTLWGFGAIEEPL